MPDTSLTAAARAGAATDALPGGRILMCAPEHFEVSYAINPWMRPDRWQEEGALLGARSSSGWERLVDTLRGLGVELEFAAPQPGLPDMVFTANAAVVLDGKALVATFRHPQRQGETPVFRRTFDALKDRGLLTEVHDMPAGVVLEGAGDCVWDPVRRTFWLGYGQRSDKAAAPVVRDLFGVEVEALELVDPRFYHMDTCLCPLTGGEVLYFPGAFSAEGNARILERFGAENLIVAPEPDACTLAVNAVNLGRDIVLATASPALRGMLTERGYRVHETPVSDFGLSGGSAFCLILKLDRVSK
ncbi:dimethylarginine dimethylaminohydrolase family protein [Nitrospirillum pindoramense]|uniref:N-dimethylarginine dimethylaminohydrolase n=1 Tax=Nitrospirillum amazonense TaxID=28077 RepID=A0A560GP89_9PROT|nr:arginine deiminase-related protein [Nitrospirillum amazonense]TWB35815.1 N-dimethylarginine dimethylaminohydrolase [Nitrospirillum amazonense]